MSGFSVSLSDNGSVVAIGAIGNDGNGTDSGHVRIYFLGDNHTLPELKTINNATSGTPVLHNDAVDLEGSSVDLSEALDGITGYIGTVNLNDDHTLSELKTINTATSGTPVLHNDAVDL